MDCPQKVSHKVSQNCMSSCVTLPLCKGQHFWVYRTCGAWYRAPPCCFWGMGWRTEEHWGREGTPKVPAGHPESQSFPPSITSAGINPTCATKSRGMVRVCPPECILHALPWNWRNLMYSYTLCCLVSSNTEMLALQSSGKISCWHLFSSPYYSPAVELPQCINNSEIMQLFFWSLKANCCGNTLSCAPEVAMKIWVAVYCTTMMTL